MRGDQPSRLNLMMNAREQDTVRRQKLHDAKMYTLNRGIWARSFFSLVGNFSSSRKPSGFSIPSDAGQTQLLPEPYRLPRCRREVVPVSCRTAMGEAPPTRARGWKFGRPYNRRIARVSAVVPISADASSTIATG